jgi:hypothetical protein
MTHRGRFSTLIAGALLAAAVAAAAPIVRWCPIRWDQISTRAFFECAVDPGSPGPACAAVAAAAPTFPLGCGGTCALAGPQARPAADECLESRTAAGRPIPTRGCGAMCPLAATASAERSDSRADDGSTTPARGRAYCLDSPGMTVASLARTPIVHPPLPAIVPHSTEPRIVPLADSRPVAPAPVARPPTALLASRPPIRGPPLLAG